MRPRLVAYVLVVVILGALLGAPVVSARGLAPAIPMEAIWKARMQGTSADPAIRGSAEYVLVAVTPLHRYFGVKLSHAGKYSGRRLAVYLGGVFVGWMRVGSLGRAHLTRNSSSQAVPKLREGHLRVGVRTRRGGALLARGTLRLVS